MRTVSVTPEATRLRAGRRVRRVRARRKQCRPLRTRRGLGLRPRRGRRGSWECRATPHTESSGVRKKRVARLMRELELRGADGRRAGPRTTVRDPKRPSARDLVDRDFARAEPNRLWSAISSTSRPGRASSSSPPSRTSTAAGSSAGRCATTSRPSSSWTRSGWRSAPAAATAPAWLHTPITVRSPGSSGRCNTGLLGRA